MNTPNSTEKSQATQWLNRQGHHPSPLGEMAADILAYVYRGIHNARMKHDVVEWQNKRCIKVVVSYELSTFDCDTLTRLVFSAHDKCVRVAIEPCNMQRLRLVFSHRERNDSLMEGHPTLEQAIAWHRGN